MSLDSKGKMLEAIALKPCYVSEVIQTLRWKASRVISLSEQMREEKLLKFMESNSSKRGRPRKKK